MKEYEHTNNMKTYSTLFTTIKNKWPTLDESEMDDIGNIASDLLNLYMTYGVFKKIEDGTLDAKLVGFSKSNKAKK